MPLLFFAFGFRFIPTLLFTCQRAFRAGQVE
jgi:hypothetical protein